MAGIAYLIAAFVVGMLAHELGHLLAARSVGVRGSEIALGLGPKLCGVRVGGVRLNLRLLPFGSFVRLDGDALAGRTLPQRLFVQAAGIFANLLLAALTYGTLFGYVNLLLGAGNLLPLYKHDGWKCGLAIMRALLRRESRPAEWAFTFSGGVSSVALVYLLLLLFK
jgi:membrane-associated protease RseP (regulator of RpoE activity)